MFWTALALSVLGAVVAMMAILRKRPVNPGQLAIIERWIAQHRVDAP